jgi:hypothetical protein
MTTDASRPRRPRLPAFDGQWYTLVVRVSPDTIKTVCNRFEGYDNLAVVRTPVAGQGTLHIYAWEGDRAVVDAVLTGLRMEIALERVAEHAGMFGIEGLWNS